jgi:probable rRNA maturation factor
VFHLLGYDHLNEVEATEMEGLERVVLAGLGVPDPYTAGEGEHDGP